MTTGQPKYKYFDRPMSLEEYREEKAQLDSIKGIDVSVGFVCTGGFDFKATDEFFLIDGDGLYFDT